MTAQVLTAELGNLIQESKRKHHDLRQASQRQAGRELASEKSLEELKSLSDSSEANIGAALSQHANFVNPFIIACGTRTVKFTSIAIVCLQRLITVKGVPRSRLDQVLQALREASAGGLDVQLRILQSLPSLLQNYAADIAGDLLITSLNICFVLQASKNVVVNNTASATLQQLLISVFDKVVTEDKTGAQSPTVGEAPVQNGTVGLRQAALDAYHVFNDICLLTEAARPDYLRFSSLSQTFGLELVESVLTNHPALFSSHPEQTHVLRSRLMPFLTHALVSKPNFPTAVRIVRVLYTILRRHLALLVAESGEALAALSHVLDHDGVLWKRLLCLEAFKGIFSDPALVRQLYILYDAKEGEKDILQELLATFVRVSTEKPSVIGLGHQSTIPVQGYSGGGTGVADTAVLEASGMSGMVTNSSLMEGTSTGISSQWSTIRTPCIDQLDKAEPLTIPDSYIFSLILACITSLSEGLAKFILPLTVPRENRNQKRLQKQDVRANSSAKEEQQASAATAAAAPGLERSASARRNPIPRNPLLLKDHPLHAEVKAYADMIDRCWPAILATCSTFLYSALDSEYYHALVRSFQRFTHVAGLLQLNTPRDAFLTTLGKAAVPPNVITACHNAGVRPMTPTSSGGDTPTSLFGNARGLLSVDSLVSQSSPAEKPRQVSGDMAAASINTRNLLCLRALLNLGIALGPTLESSWQIVLETLQQADFVLFTSGKAAGRTLTVVRSADPQAEAEASQLLSNFGSEIKAVETAASRLFESTADFPNAAFVEFVVAICSLLEKRPESPTTAGDSAEDDGPESPETTPRKVSAAESSGSGSGSGSGLKPPVVKHKRVMSITTAPASTHTQEDQFVLAKLGDIASINLERLLYSAPEVSGWIPLTRELTGTLSSALTTITVRMRAAETLVRFVLEATSAVAGEKEVTRSRMQLRLLEALRDSLLPMQNPDRTGSITTASTDIDIHKVVLDGLKSLLEDSGEALINGWNVVFEIIDSLFMEDRPSSVTRRSGDASEGALATRSTRLIKPSFASLQLICSDFLSSLPNTCYLSLVNTLYKFCTQGDDLNVALTTVTFYWAISDFLHGRSGTMSIAAAMEGGSSDAALVKLANDTAHPGSGAALWMLLLLRLTAVTTDQRLELRNSAVQTLLRIIHAYGNSLSAEAWAVCIRSVIFRLLSSTEGRLRTASEKTTTSKSVAAEWNETAVVIVNGVSELLANYLDVLASHAVFPSLWEDLLQHFAAMLDFKALDVSTAVFGSLASILSKSGGRSRWSFDKKAVDLSWGIWSRGIPALPVSDTTPAEKDRERGSAKGEDNQRCLVSWVNAFVEIERLMRDEMDLEKTNQALDMLHHAVLGASPGSYANDIEYMTALQSQVLEVFKVVRTDIPGAASAVIIQLASLVSVAFDAVDTSPQRKRTFVAMSKESMAILQHLVKQHADGPDIYASGAFATALSALAKAVTLKYRFPITTKSLQPWKAAINAALSILETALPHLKEKTVPRPAFQGAWDTIAEIANGIIGADLQHEQAPQDGRTIAADQQFDIDAFHQLRELIIPSLGSAAVAEKTRKAYAEGLFRMSILHPPSPTDAALLSRTGAGHANGDAPGSGDLSSLYKAGRGRTIDPAPTKRANMSYVCLDELFALVSTHDEDCNKPSIVVVPPTPRLPQSMTIGPPPLPSASATGSVTASDSSEHALHVRLAQTAAPYLILRCALTIRSYVSDQPLRGHMPQPLSQRRELSRILRCLVDLKSEPGAIPDLDGVDSDARKHLLRLYPLLVKASQVAGTAGDDKTLALVGEALDAVGTELGV
ncbi:Endocytosis and vacuole integrity protein [Sporothrix curviconia]|uniref:Endocytosis and vacuole integrity protein n=1 Tax=Sporothrix curviconia TaxID=1260050 RepID=A0ABP0AUV9_9PEZI